MTTHNKLVIRRLPPSMSEEEFVRQVSPLPEHDYFCFFEANPNLGSHAYSRAYINFLDSDSMTIFREQFDNYVFVDKNGHEYPALVEQSFWNKSPSNGPFRRAALSTSTSSNQEEQTSSVNGLEDDGDFLDFVHRVKGPKRKSQQSPIQTLETNLDAITNESKSVSKDKSKKVTPLVGYVNKKRMAKGGKRGR